jgi:hypothetical protein
LATNTRVTLMNSPGKNAASQLAPIVRVAGIGRSRVSNPPVTNRRFHDNDRESAANTFICTEIRETDGSGDSTA